MEGDVSNALEALRSNPESSEALAKLLQAAEKLGNEQNWEEAAKVYETALKTAKRDAELRLLVALGQVYWQRLHDEMRAEALFRKARKIDPRQPVALDFYRAYYRKRDELPQLLNALSQAQRAEEDEAARTRLGIEMARLAEERPQTQEKAIDLWKGILRKEPGLHEAVEALKRLYLQTEKWNALTELLKDEVDRLDATRVDDKIAIYLEMIPIYRDKMHLEVMVTNYYQAILKLKPDHVLALTELAEFYEKKARYPDLVNVLGRLAEVAATPEERIALYRRVARLWSERLGKPQNAAAALEKVLAQKPDDEEAQRILIELYTKGRRWKELLEIYSRQRPHSDPDKERERLVEMARLAMERLSDYKQAADIWSRVLSLHPDDIEALQALASIYERDKAWRELADVLGRHAALLAGDTQAQAALLERQGALLCEKLDAPSEARPVLEKLLVLSPDNVRGIRLLRETYGKLGEFDALEAMYAARGAYEEACEALVDFAERASEERVANALYERVALIATEKLHQPERAIKAYERIIATDPGHRLATDALAELYRNTEKWSRLLESYELRLGGSGSETADSQEKVRQDKGGKNRRKKKGEQLPVAEQLAIMAEARVLCEERLGSKALAFKWAQRAHALSPQDDVLFAELERLGEAAEEWVALAEIYGKRLAELEGANSSEQRATLLRKSLRIATSKTKRMGEARRLADALLALVPDDAEAEAALQAILLSEEKWPEVVALMRRRQARISEPRALCELLLNLARIQEEKLLEPLSAIESLRQALQADGKNERVLATLARLYETTGDHAGLADVLSRQADNEETTDGKVALLVRLARLCEDHGAQAEARAAYQRVLDIDPMSPEAIAGLERALFDGALAREQIPPVAERLVRYYETTERLDRWAEALEAWVSATDDEAERLRHLETLTGLYEDAIGDKVEAYGAALRIFQIAPERAPNRERLIRLANEAGRLTDLARSIEEVLVVADEPALRVELLSHLAEIEDRQPGHAAQAEKAFRQILEVEPLHVGANSALVRMMRDGERWKDLRELLEKREKHVKDNKEKIALLAQIAEIDESLLGDREHAVATLTRQLELQPEQRGIYHALERLLTALGRWSTLAKVLEQEVAIVPEADRKAVVFKRLEILTEKLGNFDEALDVLEAILKADPDDEDALRMVERLLRKPKAKQRAANLLGPIYNKKEQWEGLVEVLQIRRAALQGGKALAALKKIAELQELKLSDEAGALATWQSVLELDPNNAEALQAVERLSAMLERPEDLVALYREMASKKDRDDLRGRAELLVRAARLCVSSLGDRQRAASLWQEVLDLDRTSSEFGRQAAEALEALYPQIGEYEKLIEILNIKLEWETSPSLKAAYHVRIADLCERALKDSAGALQHLQEAFELVPDDVRLLDRLEPIYTKKGAWANVVEVLARRLALATGQRARVELRWRMADIYERELKALDDAIAMVQANLDESGEEKAALDVLDRLYERKGAYDAQLGILERRLVLTDAPADRVALLKRVAALLYGVLAQPREALERWREILLHAPDDADTIAQVENLLGRDGELSRMAAEILEPIYEVREDWNGLARSLVVFIETEPDRRARMRLWCRLADLRRARLGEESGAFTALGKAIEEALGEEEIVALLDQYEDLGAKLGRNADVLALYKQIEPDVLRDDVKLRIERRMAAAALESGDLVSARDRLLCILDQAPEDAGALLGLDRIYRQMGDDAQLYELLVRRAEIVFDDGPAEFPLRVEAGALAQKLGRIEDAIAAYERALELRQQDDATVVALQALYEKAERWVDLRELLERRLLMAAKAADVVDLHERMARLEIDELGDRRQAIEHLREILKRQPDHAQAVALAERLLEDVDTAILAADLLDPVYTRRNDWANLVKIHEIRRDQIDVPSERVAWTRRIARIFEEQVEDLEQAFEWYGKLFIEVPGEKPVQEQLLRLAPKLGKWKRLAEILEEYLDDEMSDTDEVLSVVKLTAWIQDEQLADREAARKHYRRYLDARPDSPEAFALFERALERWEAWEELLELIEDQANRAQSVPARVALLKKSAAISEARLADKARAAETLRHVLDELPDDRAASDERERILREEKRWDDVADHLRWRLETEQDASNRLGVALRLARLEQNELGDVEAAIEQYAEILAGTPAQADARMALEALLQEPDHRAKVAEILEHSYRHTGTLDRLAAVLRIRIETTDNAGERVMLLQEAASLEERLGHVGEALEARGRVWLEDVGDEGALAALEAAVPGARAYDRFVSILLEGAERTDDMHLRAGILARAAKVVEGQLGDCARAIAIWQEAVKSEPDEDAAYRALERLLEGEGRMSELVATLEQHAENCYDAEARILLQKRAAQLAEHSLREPERAVRLWNAVLENAERDGDALDALARLYASARRFIDLAEIYQRKIESAQEGSPGTVRMLRFLAARLYDEELKLSSEATAQLRAILDEFPGDVEALEALDRIYSRERQNLELLEILDLRAQYAKNSAEQDALAFRAAQLLARELGDEAGAIERYRQIVARTPGFKPARDALWESVRKEDYRITALSVLEPLLRAGNNPGELIELLELKLGLEDSPAGRVLILSEMAGIEENARRDLVKAFEIWTRAFAEDPADADVRAALERIARARGDFRKLAAIYEDALQKSYDAEQQKDLALRLAALAEGELRDPERALVNIKRAIEYGGEDASLLARMAAILRARARWEELVDVLGRQAMAAGTSSEQAVFLSELGKVRLEKLGDRRGAFEAFRDALERDPAHGASLSALRNLLRYDELKSDIVDVLLPLADARGDHAERIALYEVRAGQERNPVDAAAWLQKIGELHETETGDRAAALTSYAKALLSDAENQDLWDAVSRVARAMGKPGQGARAIEAALARLEGHVRVSLCEIAAGLYLEAGTAADAQAAERLYRAILQVDPEHADALLTIEKLYRSRGDREQLARILEQRAAVELDGRQQAALRIEAAQLHEQRGDLKAAIANWEAAREADDGNKAVLDALVRLYERERQHEKLVGALEDRARGEDDNAAKARLYIRIAELRAGPLEDDSGAMLALREAIDIDPDSVAAFEALLALTTAKESWSDLEEALLARSTRVTGVERRTLLFKLAENARDRLEDADRAMGYLRQILDEEPGNLEATTQMEKLLSAAERWHDLIELIEARAEAAKAARDLAGERRERLRVAEIWAEKLDAPDSACESVEAIVKSDPRDLPSLITLGGLYTRAGRHEEAIATLQKAVAARPTGRTAADLYHRLAQALEAKQQISGAVDDDAIEKHLLAAVDADRTHVGALRALADMSRRRNKHAQLVQVLEFLERHAKDDDERVATLKEIVALYSGPLGKADAAMPALERLVALAPDDLEAREAYGTLLARSGRAAEGQAILNALVDELTKKRQMKAVARIRVVLGQVAEARGDLPSALEHLQAAFKIEPAQPAVLAALGRVAESSGDVQTAMRCYRALLLQTFDETALGLGKADIYYALGRLHVAAGESAKAKNMFERGLEAAPSRSDIKAALAQLK